MAGSLKWFEYSAESGDVFAIFMDESNGEAVSNPDYTDASAAIYAIPRNLIARYARYVSDDGLYTRKIPVCATGQSTTTLPATISASISGSATAVTLRIRDFNGERFKSIPVAADTSQTDGDAT